MVKKFAMIFGVILIILGAVGFVNNPIAGIFVVDTVHNLIHIILGIILLVGSKGTHAARSLQIVGGIAALLGALGFLMMGGEETIKLLGLATVNNADNCLHLAVGAILLVVGFKGGSMTMAKPMSNTPTQPQGGMGGMNNGQM